MSKNSVKLCRFCMYEENCGGDTNNVLNVFDSSLIGIPEKIKHSIQLYLTPDDIIPPNICKKCIDNIEKFYNFLEICHKSDIMLQEIFKLNTLSRNISQLSTNHLSNEGTTESSSTITKKISNYSVIRAANSSKTKDNIVDDYTDESDSDSPSANDTKRRNGTNKCRENVSCSNSDTTLYSDGKKTEVYAIDESMRKVRGENVYECNICFKKFKTFFEYQNHQSAHNGQFVCSCSKYNEVFYEKQKLVRHDNKYKVPCKICKRKIMPKSLTAHMRKHTNKQKCNNCAKYVSKVALQKHLRAHHGGIESLNCYLGGKESNCQSSMTRHMAYNNNADFYYCAYCNFSAKSKSILRVHTFREHKGKKCMCEICAKWFKSESSLKRHKERIHNPKKYVCSICRKDFFKECNLKMHIKTHTQQRMHDCQVWGNEFVTVKQLKEHMHTHRDDYISCPNCGKEFFYRKYLDKHILKCMPGLGETHFRAIAWDLKSTISLPSSSLWNLK